MNTTRVVLAGALVLACAVHASAQSVSVRFEEGRVTLSAQNAPLRTILAEWSRVGGSRIVNAERVPGQPLTLEFTNVTEREAIAVLLRGVSGYIVATRPEQVAGRSAFDRIFILPTSAPVRQAPAAAAAPAPAPNPVVFVPGSPNDAGDMPPNGLPRIAPAGAAATPFQRDQEQLNQQLREAAERAAALRDAVEVVPDEEPPASQRGRTPATSTPGSPFGPIQGSTRPGEISPAPQQGQPRNPLRPNGDPEP